MSQRDFLRSLDAQIVSALTATGLSDGAVFRQKGTFVDVPCTILIDRTVLYTTGDGTVRSDGITITAQLAEIPVPLVNATFTVGDDVNGYEVFKVDRVENKDESRVVCVVTL